MLVVNRDFATFSAEHETRPWISGRSGRILRLTQNPSTCVKVFAPPWEAREVKAWAEIACELRAWINRGPLSKVVEVSPPSECGLDYVVRPFVNLPVATTDIASGSVRDDGALQDLQERTLDALRGLRSSGEPAAEILADVASRSLAEPSSNTFWDPSAPRFIVAEPKVTFEEARLWREAKLS